MLLYNAYGTFVPTGLPLCSSKGDFMKDIFWKDIKGFEGLYQISSDGFVLQIKKDKIRKTNINSSGYLHLILSHKGFNTTKYIHRLVAEAFLPNNNLLLFVNHINGIKTDNRVENLEWVSRSYNQLHAYQLNLQIPKQGSEKPMSKLNENDIVTIFNYHNLGMSNVTISRLFKVSDSTICNILKRNSWKHISIS